MQVTKYEFYFENYAQRCSMTTQKVSKKCI